MAGMSGCSLIKAEMPVVALFWSTISMKASQSFFSVNLKVRLSKMGCRANKSYATVLAFAKLVRYIL